MSTGAIVCPEQFAFGSVPGASGAGPTPASTIVVVDPGPTVVPFPTGMSRAVILIFGASGGGGGSEALSTGGGGGGAGGGFRRIGATSAAGDLTITIGEAGTGGIGNADGNSGGDTIVDQTTSVANVTGGGGGSKGTVAGGGAGGVISGGSITGTDFDDLFYDPGTAGDDESGGTGGNGGINAQSPGAHPAAGGEAPGGAGTGGGIRCCGGGGGGADTGTGGNGVQGLVRIYWYE